MDTYSRVSLRSFGGASHIRCARTLMSTLVLLARTISVLSHAPVCSFLHECGFGSLPVFIPLVAKKKKLHVSSRSTWDDFSMSPSPRKRRFAPRFPSTNEDKASEALSALQRPSFLPPATLQRSGLSKQYTRPRSHVAHVSDIVCNFGRMCVVSSIV